MVSDKLPPKIKSLFLLQDIKVRVPPFVIIDYKAIDDIEASLKKTRTYFKDKGSESVIIRSAVSCEDSGKRTFAGVFESSKPLPVETLSADVLLKYWRINEKKGYEVANKSKLYLFVQEYIASDYSGVLFTQDIYDANESVLLLSSSDFAITDGKNSEKKIALIAVIHTHDEELEEAMRGFRDNKQSYIK